MNKLPVLLGVLLGAALVFTAVYLRRQVRKTEKLIAELEYEDDQGPEQES